MQDSTTTTTNTAPPARRATGHANYPGDVTTAIARDVADGHAFGPNYMGELMWPVSADYDTATDKTRVGFSLIAPQGVTL